MHPKGRAEEYGGRTAEAAGGGGVAEVVNTPTQFPLCLYSSAPHNPKQAPLSVWSLTVCSIPQPWDHDLSGNRHPTDWPPRCPESGSVSTAPLHPNTPHLAPLHTNLKSPTLINLLNLGSSCYPLDSFESPLLQFTSGTLGPGNHPLS